MIRRVGGGAIEFLSAGEPARSKRAAGRDHEGEPADRHHHRRLSIWKFKHIFATQGLNDYLEKKRLFFPRRVDFNFNVLSGPGEIPIL